MAKFPLTVRAAFTKLSGAAPGAAISLTPEDSRFLVAVKEAVAPTQLVNTVAPVVSGTAQVGQTLSCTQGTWTGANGVYTYEWQADFGGGNFQAVPHGNGASTFVLTAAQLGAIMRCRVRGINGAGPRFGNSNSTTAVIAA